MDNLFSLNDDAIQFVFDISKRLETERATSPADFLSANDLSVGLQGAAQYIDGFEGGRFTLPEPLHEKSNLVAKWAKNFCLKYAKELRKILCDESKIKEIGSGTDLSLKTGAVAVASWITHSFGIQGDLALGAATAVMLTLSTALHRTICTMTDDEVQESLRPKDSEKSDLDS